MNIRTIFGKDRNGWLIVPLLMVLLLATSCQKELPDSLKNVEVNQGENGQGEDSPEISLDTNSMEFTAEGGSRSFNIKSNTSWTLSSDKSWYSVSPTSGRNNGSVTVSVEENTSTSSRTAMITVGSEIGILTVKVTQDGATSSPLQDRTFTVGGVQFKMIAVEGGTFTMGATSEQGSDAWDNEKPTHSVTLSNYSIGETEVTQALWQAVMGSNPSYFSGSNRPVEKVSWIDCQDFINKLNAMTGENFRLPTEAEWEFAARGGNKSRGYKYAGSNTIDDVAWYGENSSDKTHDVATKLPNELGLYDMSGNVWEWCYDWYGDYSSSAQTNPTGPTSSGSRVFRGGSWNYFASYCRTSDRIDGTPSYSDGYVGFRLALSEFNPEFLDIDTGYLKFTSDSGSKTFKITSNTSWTVVSDQTWCSVSPTSGSGDGSVTVSVQENTFTSSRTATVTVESASITLTLTVTQSGTAPPSSQDRTFTVGGVQFKMIAVEGGTFTMGATSEQGSDAYHDEKPTHSVTLSSYSIGETEVTQALWQAVMGSNPSYFSGSNRPVEEVSWNDCQDFITKLNAMTGENFRLPTEAEWEFAARGGNKSRGYKYTGSNRIDDVAWYYDNSYDKGLSTHAVATKQANELGLYDMSGNVWEWCYDWYGNYSSSAQTNPTGPASGRFRVGRGGSWSDDAGYCRTSRRNGFTPSSRYYGIGFRLAL